MIHRFSLSIADFLFYRKIITIEKYDVYTYGLEIILSSVLGALLIILCGILTNSLVHALLFYGLFVVIRMHTGGYHADSHIVCKITLCGSFLITEYIFKLTLAHHELTMFLAITLINLASVIFIAPVECVKKPLSNYIKRKNKIISIILYFVLSTLSIYLYITSYYEPALFLILVISDITLLMYIGTIKERGRRHETR